MDFIFKERVQTQRDSIFGFLRDILRYLIEESFSENGLLILKDKLSHKEFESIVNLVPKYEMLLENLNDKQLWLQYIISQASGGYPIILSGEKVSFTPNSAQNFQLLLEAILSHTWCLRTQPKPLLSYGLLLYGTLDILLSINDWSPELYQLSTTIDDCTRDFIYFAGVQCINTTRKNDIDVFDIKDKEEREKAEETKAQNNKEKHRKTARYIFKKLQTGVYDKLEGDSFSQLTIEAARLINSHNKKFTDKKKHLSPTSTKHLKSVLEKHFRINSTEKLPNPKKIIFHENP